MMLAQEINPLPWLDLIAKNGVFALITLVIGWAYLKKDAELTKERALRLEDAKAVTNIVTPMVEASTAARVAATNAQEAQNRLMETLTRNLETMAGRLGKVQ